MLGPGQELLRAAPGERQAARLRHAGEKRFHHRAVLLRKHRARDIQQFTTDYQTSKIYEIPPNDGWFKLNEQAGLETFYLVASAQRLTDLEQLLATYAAAQPAEQPLAATNILAELRNLLKQHRASVKPGRPVPIAGNMRKGVEGVEITAPQFYIETFTIEHS